MNKRALFSLFLLSIMQGILGVNNKTCFEKFTGCAKATILCPGYTCMRTSCIDIMEKSISDIPCLSPCFHEDGEYFYEWNYLPVTVLLAAGVIYGLTRKPVLAKAFSLVQRIKKKLVFEAKKREEAKMYRKIARWKKEVA
jgi:hypothetical protein